MTLVEVIVVTAIIGLITTVIAAAFVTIVRVSPTTVYRIDDARSTRGLQTWLARDIASTPPIAYDPTSRVGYVQSSTSPIAAGVPPSDVCTTSGIHVLFMAWRDGSASFSAQYTIEGSATDGYKVKRSMCGDSNADLSVTGDVAPDQCAARPRSVLTAIDSDSDGLVEATVELCFMSTQPGPGLLGGDARQEITISVASRNGDT